MTNMASTKCKDFNDFIEKKIYPEMTLKVSNRDVFHSHLKEIRLNLVKRMINEDEIFHKIWAANSCSHLNESENDWPYGINFCLVFKLPYNNLIKVERDMTRPGYMRLNLRSILEKMKSDLNYFDVYKKLNGMILSNGCLIRSDFHKWLESVLTKVFTKKNIIKIKIDQIEYTLEYEQSFSTGHHVLIRTKDQKYSIEFCPAFLIEKFDFNKTVPNANLDNFTKEQLSYWFAIPKPSVGSSGGRRMVYSVYFPTIENQIIKEDNNNLRKVFGLLIKLGDKQKAHKFKGYYVRNIFLWEYTKQPKCFWSQSIDVLLVHMVDTMLKYVIERNLPFFWEEKINLLAGFTECDCTVLGTDLKAIKNRLVQFGSKQIVDEDKLLRFFLNRNELSKLHIRSINAKLAKDLVFKINSLTL